MAREHPHKVGKTLLADVGLLCGQGHPHKVGKTCQCGPTLGKIWNTPTVWGRVSACARNVGKWYTPTVWGKP